MPISTLDMDGIIINISGRYIMVDHGKPCCKAMADRVKGLNEIKRLRMIYTPTMIWFYTSGQTKGTQPGYSTFLLKYWLILLIRGGEHDR